MSWKQWIVNAFFLLLFLYPFLIVGMEILFNYLWDLEQRKEEDRTTRGKKDV